MIKGLNVKNENNVGRIYIYGEITDEKYWDEDVTPKEIVNELNKIKDSDSVELFVNSPGGSVYAGVAIYNSIKRLNKNVVAFVDGIAASIASLIIMSANKIIMPVNASLFLHNPLIMMIGNSKELRDTADRLDRIKEDVIIPAYTEKTGLSNEKISELLDNETYLVGQEAKDLGFADEIEEEQKIAACINENILNYNGVNIDLKKYKNFPRNKFIEHKPKMTLKQRHEHEIFMLTAKN